MIRPIMFRWLKLAKAFRKVNTEGNNMKSFLTIIGIALLVGCSAKGSISQPPNDEEIAAAKALGSPIAISAIYGERNVVGGIEIMMSYQNISSKTFKYVDFDVVAINAVGDVVAGSIKKKKVNTLKDTGPIKVMGWGAFPRWKNAIYQKEAIKLAVISASIEYMDGTTQNISGLNTVESASGPIESKRY